MSGVEDTDGILDIDKVRSYLEQVAPVDFDKMFGWSKIIQSKLRVFDFAQSNYNIFVGDNNNQNLISKPYRDSFISDRLRKLNDNISEVEIKEFIYNGSTIAHLWYAKSSFFGTLQDDAIKGVRVRKGNILIGDKTTLNHVFKDERFNGWLFGELHVISDNLIPNARRDEIEKNATYAALVSQLKEWADGISSEIRKTSNQRSTDKKAQRIIEFAQNEMTPAIESVTTIVLPEVVLTSQPEVDEVNHTELVTALDLLVGTQQSNTKYKALNLQSNITVEQKQVLERVFDIICDNNQQTDELITKIIREFIPKSLITS